MKPHLILPVLLIISNISFSQDTIIKTSGEHIIAVVQEVGTAEIKYKKYATRQTSPVYDIAKSEVSMIKYADGTMDKFPPVQVNGFVPVYQGEPVDSSVFSKITGGNMYLVARIAPLNLYNGSNINHYWDSLFGSESHGSGTIKNNTGNTTLYNFAMGFMLTFNKRSNWGFEIQYEGESINNLATYPDGSTGSLTLQYSAVNTTFQYTRGTDTSNRLQIGGEISFDFGIMSGHETDVLNGTNYPYTQNINVDYDDIGIGGHINAIVRYYMGKSKNFGLEARAGYRAMKIATDNFPGVDAGVPGSINWSGMYLSLGAILSLNMKPTSYCYNGYEYYYQ